MLKDHIKKTWVISEASRLFFINMKDLKKCNAEIIKVLSNNENITYNKYNILATGTRIEFINKETYRLLHETSFKLLLTHYEEKRKEYDKNFRKSIAINKIIEHSTDFLTIEEKNALVLHHKEIIKFSNKILKEFVKLNMVERDD